MTHTPMKKRYLFLPAILNFYFCELHHCWYQSFFIYFNLCLFIFMAGPRHAYSPPVQSVSLAHFLQTLQTGQSANWPSVQLRIVCFLICIVSY